MSKLDRDKQIGEHGQRLLDFQNSLSRDYAVWVVSEHGYIFDKLKSSFLSGSETKKEFIAKTVGNLMKPAIRNSKFVDVIFSLLKRNNWNFEALRGDYLEQFEIIVLPSKDPCGLAFYDAVISIFEKFGINIIDNSQNCDYGLRPPFQLMADRSKYFLGEKLTLEAIKFMEEKLIKATSDFEIRDIHCLIYPLCFAIHERPDLIHPDARAAAKELLGKVEVLLDEKARAVAATRGGAGATLDSVETNERRNYGEEMVDGYKAFMRKAFEEDLELFSVVFDKVSGFKNRSKNKQKVIGLIKSVKEDFVTLGLSQENAEAKTRDILLTLKKSNYDFPKIRENYIGLVDVSLESQADLLHFFFVKIVRDFFRNFTDFSKESYSRSLYFKEDKLDSKTVAFIERNFPNAKRESLLNLLRSLRFAIHERPNLIEEEAREPAKALIKKLEDVCQPASAQSEGLQFGPATTLGHKVKEVEPAGIEPHGQKLLEWENLVFEKARLDPIKKFFEWMEGKSLPGNESELEREIKKYNQENEIKISEDLLVALKIIGLQKGYSQAEMMKGLIEQKEERLKAIKDKHLYAFVSVLTYLTREEKLGVRLRTEHLAKLEPLQFREKPDQVELAIHMLHFCLHERDLVEAEIKERAEKLLRELEGFMISRVERRGMDHGGLVLNKEAEGASDVFSNLFARHPNFLTFLKELGQQQISSKDDTKKLRKIIADKLLETEEYEEELVEIILNATSCTRPPYNFSEVEEQLCYNLVYVFNQGQHPKHARVREVTLNILKPASRMNQKEVLRNFFSNNSLNLAAIKVFEKVVNTIIEDKLVYFIDYLTLIFHTLAFCIFDDNLVTAKAKPFLEALLNKIEAHLPFVKPATQAVPPATSPAQDSWAVGGFEVAFAGGRQLQIISSNPDQLEKLRQAQAQGVMGPEEIIAAAIEGAIEGSTQKPTYEIQEGEKTNYLRLPQTDGKSIQISRTDFDELKNLAEALEKMTPEAIQEMISKIGKTDRKGYVIRMDFDEVIRFMNGERPSKKPHSPPPPTGSPEFPNPHDSPTSTAKSRTSTEQASNSGVTAIVPPEAPALAVTEGDPFMEEIQPVEVDAFINGDGNAEPIALEDLTLASDEVRKSLEQQDNVALLVQRMGKLKFLEDFDDIVAGLEILDRTSLPLMEEREIEVKSTLGEDFHLILSPSTNPQTGSWGIYLYCNEGNLDLFLEFENCDLKSPVKDEFKLLFQKIGTYFAHQFFVRQASHSNQNTEGTKAPILTTEIAPEEVLPKLPNDPQRPFSPRSDGPLTVKLYEEDERQIESHKNAISQSIAWNKIILIRLLKGEWEDSDFEKVIIHRKVTGSGHYKRVLQQEVIEAALHGDILNKGWYFLDTTPHLKKLGYRLLSGRGDGGVARVIKTTRSIGAEEAYFEYEAAGFPSLSDFTEFQTWLTAKARATLESDHLLKIRTIEGDEIIHTRQIQKGDFNGDLALKINDRIWMQRWIETQIRILEEEIAEIKHLSLPSEIKQREIEERRSKIKQWPQKIEEMMENTGFEGRSSSDSVAREVRFAIDIVTTQTTFNQGQFLPLASLMEAFPTKDSKE